MITRKHTQTFIGAVLAASCGQMHAFTPTIRTPPVTSRFSSSEFRTSSELQSQRGGFFTENTRVKVQVPDGSLKAVLIPSREQQFVVTNVLEEFLLPVLSASLLITGTTFGAGCLVLPDLASETGLAPFSMLFVTAYAVNLISGLVIAEVAIKQKESSGTEVPSSFKEFAERNLDSHGAGASLISGISLFVNACVMTFDLSRIGAIGNSLTGIPEPIMSAVWAGGIVALMTSQSSEKLSNIASMCVIALFLSFGSLLVPGIASVHDPVSTWFGLGKAVDWNEGMSHAAPIVLMAMVYQNIVPTIAKILNYDRVKTVSAICLGSLIPLTMYLAWCFACVGGGIDRSVGIESGLLMTVFSLATLAGSSIGGGMSLSEELETYISSKEKKENTNENFSLSSAALAVSMPLAVALGWNGDFTWILSVAGSFGSPLLYGVIPAVMAFNQRRASKQPNLVPSASLGVLGVLSTGFVGEELLSLLAETISL